MWDILKNHSFWISIASLIVAIMILAFGIASFQQSKKKSPFTEQMIS